MQNVLTFSLVCDMLFPLNDRLIVWMNIWTQCQLLSTHWILILIGTECIHLYSSSQKSHGVNQSILVQHSVTTIVSLSMSSMHISIESSQLLKYKFAKQLRILLRIVFHSMQMLVQFVGLLQLIQSIANVNLGH